MNRRTLLVAAALLPVVGCAQINLTPSSLASDAALIVNGINTVAKNYAAGFGLPANTVNQIQVWAAAASKAASDISATISTASSLTNVQAIATALNGIVGVLATVPVLPPVVTAALTAAQVLLPVIESLVGITVPAGAAPAGMTPDAARAYLARLG